MRWLLLALPHVLACTTLGLISEPPPEPTDRESCVDQVQLESIQAQAVCDVLLEDEDEDVCKAAAQVAALEAAHRCMRRFSE